MKRGSINYSIIIIHKGKLDLNSTDQRERHRNVPENLGKEGRKAGSQQALKKISRNDCSVSFFELFIYMMLLHSLRRTPKQNQTKAKFEKKKHLGTLESMNIYFLKKVSPLRLLTLENLICHQYFK